MLLVLVLLLALLHLIVDVGGVALELVVLLVVPVCCWRSSTPSVFHSHSRSTTSATTIAAFLHNLHFALSIALL